MLNRNRYNDVFPAKLKNHCFPQASKSDPFELFLYGPILIFPLLHFFYKQLQTFFDQHQVQSVLVWSYFLPNQW